MDAFFRGLDIFVANLYSKNIFGVHQTMSNGKRIAQRFESFCATIWGKCSAHCFCE